MSDLLEDCETNNCLVVAKLRERLSIRKRATQKFDMQRFDLKKINDAEVKEQYQVKISNRFAALKNLDDNVDQQSFNIRAKRA
jgi:hypothetical protein